METFGQIVRRRREAQDKTLDTVASACGFTKSYLSMIENGRVLNPPARDKIVALERVLGIEDGSLQRAADWANTPEPLKQALQELTARQQNLTRRILAMKDLDAAHRSGELRGLIESLEHGRPRSQTTLPAELTASGTGPAGGLAQVPVINRVAAGYPAGFTDLGFPARVADSYVAAPGIDDPDAFAARVIGESMLPDYHEGDVVVFSPKLDVTDGCDCFVRLEPDHDSTFKRIFFEPDDHIRLQPLNPRFAPKTVHREQVAGLYKAVWRLQKLG